MKSYLLRQSLLANFSDSPILFPTGMLLRSSKEYGGTGKFTTRAESVVVILETGQLPIAGH